MSCGLNVTWLVSMAHFGMITAFQSLRLGTTKSSRIDNAVPARLHSHPLKKEGLWKILWLNHALF